MARPAGLCFVILRVATRATHSLLSIVKPWLSGACAPVPVLLLHGFNFDRPRRDRHACPLVAVLQSANQILQVRRRCLDAVDVHNHFQKPPFRVLSPSLGYAYIIPYPAHVVNKNFMIFIKNFYAKLCINIQRQASRKSGCRVSQWKTGHEYPAHAVPTV